MTPNSSDKLKAHYIPYNPSKKLAFGIGEPMKGPILLTHKGAIFYEASLSGDLPEDGEKGGFSTIGVDSFEHRQIFINNLWQQVLVYRKGMSIEGRPGKEYDLSEGAVKVEIDEDDFDCIRADANCAYQHLDRFREGAFELISDLERKLQVKQT